LFPFSLSFPRPPCAVPCKTDGPNSLEPREYQRSYEHHQRQVCSGDARASRGGRVGGGREAGVHEARPALHVDLLGGGGVVASDAGAAVGGGGFEDGHGVHEAGVAGGLAAAGQRHVQREVVDVGVGGRGGVGDGVGEAVGGGGRVAEARGRVEGLVGSETKLCLQDHGVPLGDVRCAGRGVGDVVREGVHISSAGTNIGGASCIEGLGDCEDRLAGLEERLGILFGLAVILPQDGQICIPGGGVRMGGRT
jgi:hypothetical protein